MSYYKVKRMSVNKKTGKATVCVADSSLRPLTYFTAEYAKDKDLEEKLTCACEDLLNGNLQPTKSAKSTGGISMPNILGKMVSLCRIAENTSLDRDLKLGEDRWRGLCRLVSEKFGARILKGDEISCEENDVLIRNIQEYDRKSVEIYEGKEEAFRLADIKIIWGAIRSIFNGMTAAVDRDGNAWLCKSENYKSGRMSKASEATALPFRNAFQIFGYGNISRSSWKDYPEINWDIFRGLELNTLPFTDFPCEEFGLSIRKEAA